jgi:Flp pilus assembly secretin CpaC
MRAVRIALLVSVMGFVSNVAPAFADEIVQVMLNQARILRLPEKTKTIIVGNPMIADVTMQKHGNLVLTGKAYGATNLIALDDKGNIIAESRIRVEASNETSVVVQRGMERETYSCAPLCQPTVSPGDAKTFFDDNSAQSERRNALSTPK